MAYIMSLHAQPILVEHIEDVGIDEFITGYREWYKQGPPIHRPISTNCKKEIKNIMKTQGQWHKTRERLKAKLEARTDLTAKRG